MPSEGERVRLARETCRLTQQELADLAGVSQRAVSDLELGRTLRPDPDTIVRIARATGYPQQFFYKGELPDLPEGKFRRTHKAVAKDLKQVRAYVRLVLELVQHSESALKLPPVNLHSAPPFDALEELETLAGDVREALGVGARDPIPNLTRAVERAGVVVIGIPLSIPGHDGFSAWPDWSLDGRPLIAVSGGHSGDRDRFTVAHELGHLILHTHRSAISPQAAESEANRFAGALLLPRAAAEEIMRPPITLRTFVGAKATFGSSIAMGIQRAKDLNLLSPAQFVSLRRQLSARRWLTSEPVEVGHERPLLIAKIVESLGGAGSPSTRAEQLGLPVFTYQSLLR